MVMCKSKQKEIKSDISDKSLSPIRDVAYVHVNIFNTIVLQMVYELDNLQLPEGKGLWSQKTPIS